ncbi:ribosome small subunit-dependent GTPase A [Aestuariibaculum sp. M13]|uniref:ribosome small subunit-dependent GTPase A n=1 Tax=Aestuariibaculum sp. M13 TaxID=2967132 RepID=UPI002159ECCA|nr:ribosome small subunit-dependent GTPase A [Aestuariibaculum sp. M13]MCR8669202.1 ribosome small subunit-dependent GTPase A [Aestuariibaculum sp. M13]
MTLEDLGYNKTLEDYRQQHNLGAFDVGRVAQEHKDRYVVVTDAKTLDCELIGNLRYTATSRNDLPVVGDCVAISEYDEGKGLIHAVLPRFSVLERQAIGKYGEAQLIASNVDYGLIIQSVNRDFNINRLERYLTLCYASKIKPIIVVTKTDLTDVQKVNVLLDEINNRIKNVSIVAVSNKTQMGMDDLKKLIYKGKTYCLLGSSGVGKSSLINSLSGAYLMKTGSISERIDRGKHVTTHRELIPLINGAILIDNPGMREVGITDASGGLESTFEKIYELTQHCKFSDCTHTTEQGCAVISAIEKGEIEESFFENYLKMEREKEHFESTVAEKRKKDKDFGKMIKHYKKSKNSNRN